MAWLLDLVFTFNRWIHIVAMTVLVGGIVFFRFVVPLATEHLQETQQLAIFGQARWIFRRIVWISVLALVLSGIISLLRVWPIYAREEAETHRLWLTSIPWAAAHVTLGLVGFALIFRVTATRRVLDRPTYWLGLALLFLLAAIFFASAARDGELHWGYGWAHS